MIEYVNAAELVARFRGDPNMQKRLSDEISKMERISKSEAKRKTEPELMEKLETLLGTYRNRADQAARRAPSVEGVSKADLMKWVVGCLEAVVKREKNIRKSEVKKAEEVKKEEDRKRLEAHLAYLEAQKNAPQYNIKCRHYVETIRGDACERSCDADMDMTFCGDRCAFATNRTGSTRAYSAVIFENHRPAGRQDRK